MSYRQLLYHIVFRTKHGEPTIPEAYEKELYAYIWGIINNKKSILYRIGGTADHVHMLVDIHPTVAVSDFMQHIKEHSSKWLSANPNFPDFKSWAVGFAVFSYSIKEKQTIINYISHQKEHHKTINFEEEYRQLLTKNEVEIDERNFLND